MINLIVSSHFLPKLYGIFFYLRSDSYDIRKISAPPRVGYDYLGIFYPLAA
jgi:hypothetical protein